MASENIGRFEFDDLIRVYLNDLDLSQRRLAAVSEDLARLRRALEVACCSIAQLQRWVIPLLTAEEQACLVIETGAGVFDGGILEHPACQL